MLPVFIHPMGQGTCCALRYYMTPAAIGHANLMKGGGAEKVNERSRRSVLLRAVKHTGIQHSAVISILNGVFFLQL